MKQVRFESSDGGEQRVSVRGRNLKMGGGTGGGVVHWFPAGYISMAALTSQRLER